MLVGWLSRGNGWHGFCDANPPYKAKNVGVRRVECASFAHSADNLDVGVSLRKTCVEKMLWGSLIPTYESTFSDLFVGGNAPPCPRSADARVCALHRKDNGFPKGEGFS